MPREQKRFLTHVRFQVPGVVNGEGSTIGRLGAEILESEAAIDEILEEGVRFRILQQPSDLPSQGVLIA